MDSACRIELLVPETCWSSFCCFAAKLCDWVEPRLPAEEAASGRHSCYCSKLTKIVCSPTCTSGSNLCA